ncbi:MAG: hypothetical protein QXO27_00505 [Candidatus Aenigmatarchaeota archaeon]
MRLTFFIIGVIIVSVFFSLVSSQTSQRPVEDTTIELRDDWNLISVTEPMIGRTIAEMAQNCGSGDGGWISHGWLYVNGEWKAVLGTDLTKRGGVDIERFTRDHAGLGLWLKVQKPLKSRCVLSCGLRGCETFVPPSSELRIIDPYHLGEVSRRPTVIWSRLENANCYKIGISQLDNNWFVIRPVLQDSTSGTTYTVSRDLTPDTWYQINVAAYTDADCSGPQITNAISVVRVRNWGRMNLRWPPLYYTVQTSTPRLEWEPVQGANCYYVGVKSERGIFYVDMVTPNTQLTIRDTWGGPRNYMRVLDNGNYKWGVSAVSSSCDQISSGTLIAVSDLGIFKVNVQS